MAKVSAVLLATLVVCSLGVSLAAIVPRSVGTIKTALPSFLHVFPSKDASQQNLFVTSFGGALSFGTASVSVIENIGQVIHNDMTQLSPTTLVKNNGLKWPNTLTNIPSSVFGVPAFTISDGFLVPGKSTGGVYIGFYSSSGAFSTKKLTKDKSGYFYHKTVLVDLNNDGRLDILTARATKPIFGSAGGELLWLEQPANDPLGAGVWTEHVITQGPDVIFAIEELDGDVNTLELVACEFFSSKVTINWLNPKTGELLDRRVIADNLGPTYDLHLVDVNMDGKKDIVVSNHIDAKHPDLAGIYAFDLPADLKKGEFVRHTLYSGFQVTKKGQFEAAPGFHYFFRPTVADTKSRPLIAVAGDGAQACFILNPVAGEDWKYESTELTRVPATAVVGSLALADVDGDGWTDLFVANYDKNGDIRVFTFAPEKAEEVASWI